MSSKKSVLLAMSGGVDSSVAAILLLEQGYNVVGVTMKTYNYENDENAQQQSGCCNLDAINDARTLAVKLGIPHYVIDFSDEFEKNIISNFISEYLNGRTPNPCVLCNKIIKWKDLLEKADELHCNYIATGHYAILSEENGRYFLKKAKDDTKDQSYVLWGLSQEQLRRTLLPLGNMHKNDIKKIAKEHGFVRIAEKSESYEICFIPDNDYRSFLKRRVPGLEQKVSGGNFVDIEGRVLGKHEGYPFYTIGQRKGLKIAVGRPLYVKSIHAETNTIVLADKEDIYSNELWANDINLMKYESFQVIENATVKVRYNHSGSKGRIIKIDDKIKVEFYEPVSAITPGQSVVFYEQNDLIGGGIIS